jgi:hypothetical protein
MPRLLYKYVTRNLTTGPCTRKPDPS